MARAREHALGRAVSELAIGVAEAVTAKRSHGLEGGLADRIERFHIKASGIAADAPVWVTGDIMFNTAFSKATGNQPRSDLEYPSIMVGFEQDLGTSGTTDGLVPVMASLNVVEWIESPNEMIEGATIAAAAIAPGDSVTFKGFFHVTFLGYGLPITDQPTGG